MYELLMQPCFFCCCCVCVYVFLDHIMPSEQVRRELLELLGAQEMLAQGPHCLCSLFEVGCVSFPDGNFWKAFPKVPGVIVTASAEMK